MAPVSLLKVFPAVKVRNSNSCFIFLIVDIFYDHLISPSCFKKISKLLVSFICSLGVHWCKTATKRHMSLHLESNITFGIQMLLHSTIMLRLQLNLQKISKQYLKYAIQLTLLAFESGSVAEASFCKSG